MRVFVLSLKTNGTSRCHIVCKACHIFRNLIFFHCFGCMIRDLIHFSQALFDGTDVCGKATEFYQARLPCTSMCKCASQHYFLCHSCLLQIWSPWLAAGAFGPPIVRHLESMRMIQSCFMEHTVVEIYCVIYKYICIYLKYIYIYICMYM